MQIEADVEKRFQQNITSIEFTYITSKGGLGSEQKSTALVYTDACPGSGPDRKGAEPHTLPRLRRRVLSARSRSDRGLAGGAGS
jgi:hypothetical protein